MQIEPQENYDRQLVYTLNLAGNGDEIRAKLEKWRFVGTSATQPIATVADGIIGIGTNDQTTFCHPLIDELENCSVECEIKIIDDGGDRSRWAGIRVRGFLYDFRFGYLVYLRSSGAVELYRAEMILAAEQKAVAPDGKDTWTRLRVDIYNSAIRVWVNGELRITESDRKFCDKGLVYLHTFGTHAQFRDLSIYTLTGRPVEEEPKRSQTRRLR